MKDNKRSAFITIIGIPNVGKSSILNRLLGHKIAIVSSKPQTTRNRITGILTEGDDQLVFSSCSSTPPVCTSRAPSWASTW